MLQTVRSLAQENEYLRNIWRSKFHSLKFFPECWRHNTFPTQAGYHCCYCCCCYFCYCFDFCLAFSIQTQGFLCSPCITGLQFVQLDFQIPLPERSRFNVLPMRGICVRLGRQKWDKLFFLQQHLACGRFVAISWKLLRTHHLQTQVDVITPRVAVISYNFLIFWRTAINLRAMFPALLLSDRFVSTHLLDLFVAVQWLSHVQLFATPWLYHGCTPAAYQASLSFTISQSLLKLMSSKSMMPSNHAILCHPLLFLPSIFPQHKYLFQWVGPLQPGSITSYVRSLKRLVSWTNANENLSGIYFSVFFATFPTKTQRLSGLHLRPFSSCNP